MTESATTERQCRFWTRWLQVMLVLLLAYALVLVFAGAVAAWLFDALGFGPSAEIASDAVLDYLRLPFAVLGAVMAGWALQMLLIVRCRERLGTSLTISMIAIPLALWFVLDTGMSIVLGHPAHALFNVPFAAALGLPLWRLWAIGRATRGGAVSPRGSAG